MYSVFVIDPILALASCRSIEDRVRAIKRREEREVDGNRLDATLMSREV